MKHFRLVIPLLSLLFIGLTPMRAWAVESYPGETLLVALAINKKISFDLEIIKTTDGRILLPVKYLADLLDIAIIQTPEDKAVTFTTPTGSGRVRLDLDKRLVTQGETFYTLPEGAAAYLESGLFSEREVFLEQGQLAKLFDVELGYSSAASRVDLNISRPIRVIVQYNREHPEGGPGRRKVEEGTPVSPDGSEARVLETISLDLQGNRNQFSSGGGAGADSLYSQTVLSPTFKGVIRKTPYQFKPSLAYGNGEFGLSGLSFRADTRLAGKPLQIGTLNVGLSPLVSPHLPVMGVQWGTPNALEPDVGPLIRRTFAGNINQPGVVTLCLNGQVTQVQDTRLNANPQEYRFEITLKEGTVNTVKISLQDADGKERTLQESSLPCFRGFLAENERAFSVFAGRTPFQFRIPGLQSMTSEKGLILPHSEKWTAGARYYRGFSNRLTGGLSLAIDPIIGSPKTSRQFLLMNQARYANLLGQIPYFRNPNFYSGAALGGELRYRFGDRWMLSGNAGVSQVRAMDSSLAGNGGFSRACDIAMTRDDASGVTQIKLFYYGNHYYSPMTSVDNGLFDRYGLEISRSGEFFGFHYGLDWRKYRMNLANTLAGGPINGEAWDFSLDRNLGKHTRFQLSTNRVRGLNARQDNLMRNDSVTLLQDLPLNAQLNLNLRRSTYATYYDEDSADGLSSSPLGQNRVQTYFNANLNIPVRQLARLSVGASVSQQYNLLSFQSNFRWRGFQFSPQFRQSVGGEQQVNAVGLGLYYEWDNQRRVGFRYLYSRTSLPSLSSLLGGRSQTVNHQLQFDFNDMLAVLGNRLLSVGRRGETTGILDCFVFFDRNRNGIQDKGEPLLPGIPLQVDRERLVKSSGRAHTLIKQLSPGKHSVDFSYDELSMNLTPTTGRLLAIIEEHRRTKAGFGVFMTPGTVSGRVIITNAAGTRETAQKDVIVSLVEKESGKEVKFTYTDKEGHYTISEIPPGQYQVRLDAGYTEQNHLKPMTKPYAMDVPLLVDDFYDRKDVDFRAIQLFKGPEV